MIFFPLFVVSASSTCTLDVGREEHLDDYTLSCVSSLGVGGKSYFDIPAEWRLGCLLDLDDTRLNVYICIIVRLSLPRMNV